MRYLYLFVIFITVLVSSCNTNEKVKEGYKITGNLKGASDRTKVVLNNDSELMSIDSTAVTNGTFSFEGKIDRPQRVTLLIYKDSSDVKFEENVFISSFYIENSDIKFSANIDSLPTFYWSERNVSLPSPEILGSQTEDLNLSLRNKLSEINSRIVDLDNQYTEVYYTPSMEGQFPNMEESIQIVNKMDSLREKSKQIKIDFIKQNPKSSISVDLLTEFVNSMSLDLSIKEGSQLIDMVSPYNENNPVFTEVKDRFAALEKTSNGQPYIDFKIKNIKGELVNLSDYLSKDKYTLVEFWASWCGPCRGEIPHLKHTYENYKNKNFDIVSISIDDKIESWDKAQAQEKMPWNQFIAIDGSKSDFLQAYGVQGIPYSFLVNPEGIIVAHNLVGARLDAKLEDLEGKR